VVFNGFLNEFENFVGNLLLRVKQCLLLIVLPVQREVNNSNRLPKIAQLGSGRVDDASHFVSDNELDILGTEFITNEESILDFYDTNHVVLFILLLRLRLRLSVYHLHHSLPTRHVIERVSSLHKLLVLLWPLLPNSGVPLTLVQVLPALSHPVIDHFLLRPHLLLLVGVGGGGGLLCSLAVILLLRVLFLGRQHLVLVAVLLIVVRHLHLVQDVHIVLS